MNFKPIQLWNKEEWQDMLGVITLAPRPYRKSKDIFLDEQEKWDEETSDDNNA